MGALAFRGCCKHAGITDYVTVRAGKKSVTLWLLTLTTNRQGETEKNVLSLQLRHFFIVWQKQFQTE